MGIGGLASNLMIRNGNNTPIFSENKEKRKKHDIVTFCEGGCVAVVLMEKNLEPEYPPYYYNCDEYIRGYIKYVILRSNENT